MQLTLTKSNRRFIETDEELHSEDGLPFKSERLGILGDTLVQRPTVTFDEDFEDSPERMPGSREKSSIVDSFQMRDSVTLA